MLDRAQPQDWRITTFQRFCDAHGVDILIEDCWQTRQYRFRMRRIADRVTVERLVSFEDVDTLLPTVLARGMLNELEKMEGKK